MLHNKLSQFYLKILAIGACALSVAHAETPIPQPEIIPHYSVQEYDNTIEQIYAKNPKHTLQTIDKRIAIYSAEFLGKKYLLGALGEGPKAKFDKSPLYRTDAFDCTTYVSTVLALAMGENLQEFKKNIIKINYQDNIVSYVQRNHFMEVDWNPKNQQNGYLQDITASIVDSSGKSVARTTQITINKPAWYKMKNASTIKSFIKLSPTVIHNLVSELHALANTVKSEKAITTYIPLSALFKADGSSNELLFNQIPSASVVEIVRVNWDVKPLIGTDLTISHMGFAIRDQRGLLFRDASTSELQIRDILLHDYLKPYLDSPTIKGINIQKIVAP